MVSVNINYKCISEHPVKITIKISNYLIVINFIFENKQETEHCNKITEYHEAEGHITSKKLAVFKMLPDSLHQYK